MQVVRFSSRWQWHEPGDVCELPQREAVHLIARLIAEPVDTPSSAARYAAKTMVRRSVSAAPSSLDEKTRTVELIFATPTPVLRENPRDGLFQEILDCSKRAIDMAHLKIGIPLLDSHKHDGIKEILGVVLPDTIRATGTAVAGKARFSRNPDGDRAYQDVKDGIIRALSVGYAIYERRVDNSATPPIHLITRWTPLEVSLVSIPADPTSGFI